MYTERAATLQMEDINFSLWGTAVTLQLINCSPCTVLEKKKKSLLLLRWVGEDKGKYDALFLISINY